MPSAWEEAPAAVTISASSSQLRARPRLAAMLVIGLPALKMGAALGLVAGDLVGFTLLGQIADRLGAVLGPVLGAIVCEIARVSGKRQLVLAFDIGIALNFVLAGLFIGLLARWYLLRHWSVTGRGVVVVAWAAAVFTNPIWGVAVMGHADFPGPIGEGPVVNGGRSSAA